jgi:predicted DsbA family dithiol-disulfide isomerase
MAGATRRDLLRIGAILGVAGIVMARPWQGLRAPDLHFEEIADLPPLRRLTTPGEVSGGSASGAVLIGLPPRDPDEALTQEERDRLRREICAVLGLSWTPGGPVPVTYFTDINCPSCRRLEADLAAISGEPGPGIDLSTREFPVFGSRSEAAARAIRAADGQGGAEEMRRHLRTRRAPDTAEGVARLGEALGLDGAALATAWRSAAVAESLRKDRGLARLLGIPGTPGLVVGRSLVVGAPGRERLAALVERERRDGPPPACA